MRENLSNINNNFSKKQNVEALKSLKKRFSKNKISFNLIKNKVVLDVGAGSGNYTYALSKIGAKIVYSIEESKTKNNISNKKIKFIKDSLHKLPFNDNTFDFVFCNGCLSHSKNWKKDILEYKRVLKKNGYIWINVFSYGKHWLYADKVKKKLKSTNVNNFIQSLLLRNWSPSKIYFLVDLFFTDRVYFTKKKIKKLFKKK